MKKSIPVLIFFVVNILLFSIHCFSEEITINSDEFKVNLLSSTDQQTTIEYNFGSFNANQFTIEGNQYYHLQLEKEGSTFEKGNPELPKITRSIIIPDNAKCEVKVIESEYVEYQMSIAPSKGILYRNVNPADVPYEFSDLYGKDEFYPSINSELGTPYILRDFRGITVVLYPFTYNPQTQTLRVYYHIKLEINNIGIDTVNVKNRNSESYNINFADIYENQFINFNTNRYTSVSEYGRMIVICDGSFLTEIQPYVDWKRQKGINTALYNVSSIGTTSSQIKNFIQDEYDLGNGLVFVQLVGDVAQIATYYVDTSYGADPVYSLLDGGDDYPDIFIGRFSGTTATHIETQVARTIHYERDISSGGWLHWALGIASAETTIGDDGETDIQHVNNIRTDLLGYNYDYVGQVYDPGALDTDVADQFNWGRSFVNYTGHGGTTNWTTSGFNTTDINNLTNSNELPFICDVACLNGNFTSTSTCFAESILRARHSSTDEPTGAIAIYASSRNQPWSPPMDAQDEVTDLLVGNIKRTIGGLFFNGSCHMMDEYAGQGDTFKSWNIFGDASLMVRTNTPTSIATAHNPHILIGDTSFNVGTGLYLARVCLSDVDSNIISSGYANYLGNITLSLPTLTQDEYTLTITAYNKTTYIASIPVIELGTWEGDVSTDWYNPLNWLGNTVPSFSDNVIIPGGTLYSPLIAAGSAYCKNLTIESGATLTQTGTSYFYVYGDFNSDAGTFTQSGSAYLYFAGDSNTSWDDDNEDDTYSYIRVQKSDDTSQVYMWQDMTVENNFEIREGIFTIDATWTLTVNSTASNALEVELGGTLNLTDESLDIAGGIEFEDGSRENIIGGLIKCGGSLAILANTSYDINFTGGILEMDGSSTQYINDQDGGTLDLYNLTIAKTGGTCYIQAANLDVNGAVVISGGALSCDNGPTPSATYDINVAGNWTNYVGTTGFTESTGRVIFDGGNYHQYCLSNETFNELEVNKTLGGAFRVNGTNVVCASYDWSAGAVDVLSGNFTANDLFDNAIKGAYYLNSGGTIDLINSGYVDLNGEIHIFGGTMTVAGTISDWPYTQAASIEMSDGVLDFTECGINITGNYALDTQITGGTIRTVGDFEGPGTDFDPTGGTVEMYGTLDSDIGLGIGSNYYNVLINKTGSDDKINIKKKNQKIRNRDGSVTELTRSQTITTTSELDINGYFILDTGSFDTNGFDMYVAGDWANNVGEVEFVEGIQKVVFDGPNSAAILSPETFYDLHVDKTYIGFAGLQTGFGDGNGVDVNVHNLEILDGTMELNNPTNLVIGNTIDISVGATLNANDAGVINISVVEDWFDDNVSGGFDAGTASVVTFNGTIPSSLHAVSENSYFNDIVINSNAAYVRPSSPGNKTIYCKNMDIVQGKLKVSSYRVVVDEALTVSGIVEMASPDDSLFVGDITWESGSTGLIADGLINVSGNWTNSGGSVSTGISLVEFDSSGDPQDVYGTNTFYDVHQINNSEYLRFYGNTTIANNLDLDFFCWANDILQVNGILDINGASSKFTANSGGNVTIATLVQGGTLVCNGGSINVTDLLEGGIFGNHTVISGVVNLHQVGSSYIDINGNVTIQDGELNIFGNYGGNSVWGFTQDASLNMSGGILDIKELGVVISSTYNFTETITGGTIRTVGGFTTARPDYNPTGGTMELYGTADGNLSIGAGSNLYNVQIDKGVSDESTREINNNSIFHARDGSVVELTRSNTASATSVLDINGDFIINSGVFNSNGYDMYVAGNWTNNVGDAGFEEGTQTVTWDGTLDLVGITSETFYSLILDKVDIVDDVELWGDVDVLGNLTLDHGTLYSNDNVLSVYGNTTLNSGGVIFMENNSTLAFGSGSQFNVYSNAAIWFTATTGNECLVTHISSGTYGFNIYGSIAPRNTIFEYMDGNGIYERVGGYIVPSYGFDNCTFRKGAPAPSALLTLNGSSVFTCDNAYFEQNDSGDTGYNIWKYYNTGEVTFNGGGGDFWGDTYEYDPNNRVHWIGGTLTPIDDLAIHYNEGANTIELTWTYPLPVDQFKVYRSTDPYDFSGATIFTTATVGYSELATGTKYFYRVTAENFTDNNSSFGGKAVNSESAPWSK